MEIVDFNNTSDFEEVLLELFLVDVIGSGFQEYHHAFSEDWEGGNADNDGEEVGAEGIGNSGRRPDVDDDSGNDDTNTH